MIELLGRLLSHHQVREIATDADGMPMPTWLDHRPRGAIDEAGKGVQSVENNVEEEINVRTR